MSKKEYIKPVITELKASTGTEGTGLQPNGKLKDKISSEGGRFSVS